MGIVELPQRAFGLEAAGVVRRIGSEVKTLKVGDRVVCSERQAFSTLITTLELLCVKIPDVLSFNEAATMLILYTTVIHSLINIGGLANRQVSEINSCCALMLTMCISLCLYIVHAAE
jgi:NADPH:quinone reductase-like Zn-dependent oxidoreductase